MHSHELTLELNVEQIDFFFFRDQTQYVVANVLASQRCPTVDEHRYDEVRVLCTAQAISIDQDLFIHQGHD